MAYVERRVAFDHDRDSDIITFLDSMTSYKANQIIRQLIRDYIKDEKNSRLDRVERKLDEVLRELRSGNLIIGKPKDNNSGAKDTDKIAELAKNLEKIGV